MGRDYKKGWKNRTESGMERQCFWRASQCCSEGENCCGILGCELHSCCHKRGNNPNPAVELRSGCIPDLAAVFSDSSSLARKDYYLN